jgi:hypothetical protein
MHETLKERSVIVSRTVQNISVASAMLISLTGLSREMTELKTWPD